MQTRLQHLANALALTSAVLLTATSPAQETNSTGAPGPGSTYRLIGAGITGASELQPAAGLQSPLTLQSSDARLVQAFDWAKRQASAYAHDDNDPVGAWYEGGEPGRESFCMRDISHQVMGGHALGFARHNLNMLRRFAGNISESRDWCSYWGMTRMNQPRRVDYRDDTRFWYCLPANFDVVAACYRMYVWTGDPAYVNDPVFLNFYEHTVTDYVERWALAPDEVLTRPRLLNIRGIFDPRDKFQRNRGIPGYDEQTKDYTAGADLLATEYAAYVAYACIQDFRGNLERARRFQQKAADLRALINRALWIPADQSFGARLDQDHKPDGRGGGVLLYHGIVDDGPKLKAALSLETTNRRGAEVLYRYGEADAAYGRMIDIAFAPGVRREYPETSFTWVGALVNGLLGVNLEAPPASDAWIKGYWVDKVIQTLPGLGTNTAWAELDHLPVRANVIKVRHDGMRKSRLTNLSGPAFIWQAAFPGRHETLLINGQPAKALLETWPPQRPVSSVRVTVGAGGAVTVEVPE